MLQANRRPVWRQQNHSELWGMRYCTIHSFCFWWITVYIDTKQACRESLMEKRAKKCGLLYFLLLFIQRRIGPVTPLITRWSTEEKQSTTKEEVWLILEKKTSIQSQRIHNWVSSQHNPYSGHCGQVFQEAACEWNHSIWLKSAGDKSDTRIISHTARLFRGTQSQSDWKDIELWTKWQLGTGWDQPGPTWLLIPHRFPEEPAVGSSLLSRRTLLRIRGPEKQANFTCTLCTDSKCAVSSPPTACSCASQGNTCTSATKTHVLPFKLAG